MMSKSQVIWSKDRVEQLRAAIEDLMAVRTVLRQYAPDFAVSEENDSKQVSKLLKRSAKQLIPLFEDLGLCAGDASPQISSPVGSGKEESGVNPGYVESGVDLLQRIGNNPVFVGSNSIKAKLKALGVEAQNIIVAGGPMHVDDLKALNPNIPDKALAGVQRKIDGIIQNLSDAVKAGKTVLAALAEQEENDQLIRKRLPEIEQKIGAKLSLLPIRTWDRL
jgi:hypothetical protein